MVRKKASGKVSRGGGGGGNANGGVKKPSGGRGGRTSRGGRDTSGGSNSTGGGAGRGGGKGSKGPRRGKTDIWSDGEASDSDDMNARAKAIAQSLKYDDVGSFEYSLPENFVDEEVDEATAFNDDDYETFGDIGATAASKNKNKNKKSRSSTTSSTATSSTSATRSSSSRGTRSFDVAVDLDDDLAPLDSSSSAKFRGKNVSSTSGRRGNQRHDDDDDDNNDDNEDDEDDDDEGGVPLSELFPDEEEEIAPAPPAAAATAASSASGSSSRKNKGQKKASGPGDVDDLLGSDDELDSDDLGGDIGDDDLDDQSHATLMSRLARGLPAAGTTLKPRAPTSTKVRRPERTEPGAEGEFRVVGSASSSTANVKLGLEDLTAGLTESATAGELKKQLRFLQRGTEDGPVAAPLPTSQLEQIARKAGYDAVTSDVTKWQPIIQANRQAEQLRFDADEPKRAPETTATLTDKFLPETALEQDLTNTLMAAGLESAGDVNAFEELAMNKMTAEEVEERRSQLAKIRNLLFYREQKGRRIGKIKSKLYRKIRRKENARRAAKDAEMEDLDPERAEELVAKAAYDRALERATLKHKNTGKWAKKQLLRGMAALDQNTKDALKEQHQLARTLRQKMSSMDDESSGAEFDDDELDALLEQGLDETDEDYRARLTARLQSMAEEEEAPATKVKGVGGLAFMKRAAAKSAKQAAQDASDALKEMDEDEDLLSSDSDEDEETRAARKASKKSKTDDSAPATGRFVFTPAGEEVSKLFPVKKSAAWQSSAAAILETQPTPQLMSKSAGVDKSSSGPLNSRDVLAEANKKPETGPRKAKAGDIVLDGSEGLTTGGLASEGASRDWKQPAKGSDHASGSSFGDADDAEAAPTQPTRPSRGSSMGKGNKAKANAAAAVDEQASEALIEQADANNPWLKPAKVAAASARSKAAAKAAASHSFKNTDTLSAAVVPADDDADMDDAEEEGEAPLLSSSAKHSSTHQDRAAQQELIDKAFAFVDVEADFVEEQEAAAAAAAAPKEAAKDKFGKAIMPGWGSWGGEGVKPRAPKRKQGDAKSSSNKKQKTGGTARKDVPKSGVIINEKVDKKLAKYQVESIPHPFTSRAAYEAAQNRGVGKEWNPNNAYIDAIKPSVVTKAGMLIRPAKYTKGAAAQAAAGNLRSKNPKHKALV